MHTGSISHRANSILWKHKFINNVGYIVSKIDLDILIWRSMIEKIKKNGNFRPIKQSEHVLEHFTAFAGDIYSQERMIISLDITEFLKTWLRKTTAISLQQT